MNLARTTHRYIHTHTHTFKNIGMQYAQLIRNTCSHVLVIYQTLSMYPADYKTLSSVDRHNVQHKYIHRQCSPRCHCHCFAQMLLTSLLISYQHAVQASATPAAALSFTQARASKRCLNTRAATVRRNTW